MSTKLRLLVAGVAFVLSAPLALAAEPAAPARLINQADLIGISVKQSLVSGAKAGNGPFDVATAEAIEKAYELRGNVPVWVDDNGYNDKAKKVIEELKRAGDWGLLAADYALPNVAGPGLPVARPMPT